MIRLVKNIALSLILTLPLAACTSLSVSNPFEPEKAPMANTQVIHGQFNDIPVAADMSIDSSKTKVTLNAQNLPVGLETYNSSDNPNTVSNNMIRNMAKYDWSLLASISGDKYVQLHHKDSRYAIIYIEDSLLGSVLEIWVFTSLGEATNSMNSYRTQSTPAYTSSQTSSAPSSSTVSASSHYEQSSAEGNLSQSQEQSAPVEVYSEHLHN